MTEQTGNNKPNEAEGLAFPLSGNEKLKREEVIEEAAKAIAGMDWLTSDHLNKARAALVVFEKAHTTTPPDGWFYMGSHVGAPWLNLEFSEEMDETGLPLWERPVQHTPTEDEKIQWRPVVGYEGMYEVSEAGDVRSLARTKMRRDEVEQVVPGKMLTKHPDRRGYHLVSLTRNHKAVHRRVHRLVLEAFVGPCPEGHEGLHGDGDMHNNRRSNLRWGTRTENVHDSMRHGTLPVGENAAAAKVTERDVRAIRAAHSAGASIRGLSKKYELALSTTQAIVHRRSWKHVI